MNWEDLKSNSSRYCKDSDVNAENIMSLWYRIPFSLRGFYFRSAVGWGWRKVATSLFLPSKSYAVLFMPSIFFSFSRYSFSTNTANLEAITWLTLQILGKKQTTFLDFRISVQISYTYKSLTNMLLAWYLGQRLDLIKEML